MNVTAEQFQAYIESLHATETQLGEDLLPAEHRKMLIHRASLLPARITGYVSTQFGVAIEYEPAEET